MGRPIAGAPIATLGITIPMDKDIDVKIFIKCLMGKGHLVDKHPEIRTTTNMVGRDRYGPDHGFRLLHGR